MKGLRCKKRAHNSSLPPPHYCPSLQGPDPATGGQGGGDNPDSSSSASRPWMTTRQMVILCILMVATLTSSFAVCLFPPFFPKIAEEKGCSATVYGFIIGTNCLTSFVVTPFIGKHVSLVMKVKLKDYLILYTDNLSNVPSPCPHCVKRASGLSYFERRR